MNTEESALIEKLRGQYFWIRNNSDKLLNACSNDPSLKARLDDAVQESLKHYVIAQILIKDQSAYKVKQLIEAAEKSQEKIMRAINDSETTKKSLDIISRAIKTVGINIGSL